MGMRAVADGMALWDIDRIQSRGKRCPIYVHATARKNPPEALSDPMTRGLSLAVNVCIVKPWPEGPRSADRAAAEAPPILVGGIRRRAVERVEGVAFGMEVGRVAPRRLKFAGRATRTSNRVVFSRTPGMAIKVTKGTLGGESRLSACAQFPLNSGRPGDVEPVLEGVLERDILDTNPYGIESYLGIEESTTTTIARTGAPRSKST
jgi:hypothetical protein